MRPALPPPCREGVGEGGEGREGRVCDDEACGSVEVLTSEAILQLLRERERERERENQTRPKRVGRTVRSRC